MATTFGMLNLPPLITLPNLVTMAMQEAWETCAGSEKLIGGRLVNWMESDLRTLSQLNTCVHPFYPIICTV